MIEVSNLCKTYKSSTGEKEALNNISFEVNPGEVIGILGPNGAGKSTLVKILATVLNRDSGEVHMAGHSINDMGNYKKNFTVAMQNSSLELWLSVEENLKIYGKFFGLNKKTLSIKIDEVIELLGLRAFRNKRASELSGGYRKRLQLARSFLVDTRVMILDEPTAGLDPIAKNQIISLLKTKALEGKSILFTTQVIHEAEELCNKILIINEGKKVAYGSIEEVKNLLNHQKQMEFTFDQPNECLYEEIQMTCVEAGHPAPSIQGNKIYFNFSTKEERQFINQLFIKFSPEGIKVVEPNLEEIFIELVKEGA